MHTGGNIATADFYSNVTLFLFSANATSAAVNLSSSANALLRGGTNVRAVVW